MDFEWQTAPNVLKTFSDADWAGCKDTRKSTTGGCITLGKHVLKGWSKTQSLVAPSSGESELYATLKAAAEALGMMSMMEDLGWQVSGEIWVDASAALGIIQRRGLGNTRRIDIGLLLIQHTAAERRLTFNKMLGKDNPADLYTKYLDTATTDRHIKTMACEFTEGRAKEAPKLHVVHCDDLDLCPMCEGTMHCNECEQKPNRVSRNSYGGSGKFEHAGTTDGLRAAGALGVHVAGTWGPTG